MTRSHATHALILVLGILAIIQSARVNHYQNETERFRCRSIVLHRCLSIATDAEASERRINGGHADWTFEGKLDGKPFSLQGNPGGWTAVGTQGTVEHEHRAMELADAYFRAYKNARGDDSTDTP